jgi:hypothetical protein
MRWPTPSVATRLCAWRGRLRTFWNGRCGGSGPVLCVAACAGGNAPDVRGVSRNLSNPSRKGIPHRDANAARSEWAFRTPPMTFDACLGRKVAVWRTVL